MILGAVCEREVRAAPRSQGLFVARAVYAGTLLGIVATCWLVVTGSQSVATLGDSSRFAATLLRILGPLQLALARGHRWLAMLESGEAKSLKEIAAREGIDNSYVSRMVNLTTLAPDIVAAILDDAMPNHVTLFDLAVDPPALWDDQRARLR